MYSVVSVIFINYFPIKTQPMHIKKIKRPVHILVVNNFCFLVHKNCQKKVIKIIFALCSLLPLFFFANVNINNKRFYLNVSAIIKNAIMSDLFCKQTVDCNQGSVRAVRYNGN